MSEEMPLTIMVVCRRPELSTAEMIRWGGPAGIRLVLKHNLRRVSVRPNHVPRLSMREDWALERWNVFGSVAEGFAWLLVAGPGAPLDARE